MIECRYSVNQLSSKYAPTAFNSWRRYCGSRSPKYIELGHFTLFCRGRQGNVQRFKTHVHSYCSAHQTFCLVTFPLPSPSWFAKTPYLLYFCPPQPRLGAIVCWNARKVYLNYGRTELILRTFTNRLFPRLAVYKKYKKFRCELRYILSTNTHYVLHPYKQTTE